jgi:NADH-quinone oxidoreductase subunit H
MISYELPLVLSLVGVVMLTSVVAPGCVGAHADIGNCGVGSISFTQIIAAQMRPGSPWLWFFILQPLGLFVYYICGLAETNRTPFDLPEAESELVAGYLTEYSGLRWAMFMLGEYGNMTIVSAVATALFLGGWSGPGAAVGFWSGHLGHFWGGVVFNVIGVFWFLVKMVFTIFIYMLIRATLPRLRADQLMRFAWLFLIPLTLLNILLTGAVLLIPVDGGLRLLFAGVSNWILLGIVFFGFRRVTGVSLTGKTPRWVRRQVAASAAAKPATGKPATTPELAGSATPR